MLRRMGRSVSRQQSIASRFDHQDNSFAKDSSTAIDNKSIGKAFKYLNLYLYSIKAGNMLSNSGWWKMLRRRSSAVLPFER